MGALADSFVACYEDSPPGYTLKVVFIQPYEWFPDFRVSREIALFSEQDEVTVILWQRSESGQLIRAQEGVKVVPIRIASRYGMKASEHLRLLPQFHRAAYAALKRLQPDLIIAHNLECVPPALFYRMSTRVPVIYVAREVYPAVFQSKLRSPLGWPVGWFLEAMLSRFVSGVVTVTPRLVRQFNRMGVKAHFVPNAPTQAFWGDRIEKGERSRVHVGFVGTLRPGCGIEEMWQAIRDLNGANEGVTYAMYLCGVAIGGFEATLDRMLAETPDIVTFIGTVAPERLAAEYANIDVTFQLYRDSAYGLSVKVYESLATATPVIIRQTREDPGFLKGSGSHLVVGDSREELRDALSRLGESSSLREEMGACGLRFIIDSGFRWEDHVETYRNLINRVVS